MFNVKFAMCDELLIIPHFTLHIPHHTLFSSLLTHIFVYSSAKRFDFCDFSEILWILVRYIFRIPKPSGFCF